MKLKIESSSHPLLLPEGKPVSLSENGSTKMCIKDAATFTTLLEVQDYRLSAYMEDEVTTLRLSGLIPYGQDDYLLKRFSVLLT